MSKEPRLWLNSDSLLSKWGFDDGSPFDDFIDWCEDNGHPRPEYAREDELLRTLVRTHLVPALDQRVELVEIETSHNPIRARTVDGVDVEDCWSYPYTAEGPTLTPDGVYVPFTDVLRAYIPGSGT